MEGLSLLWGTTHPSRYIVLREYLLTICFFVMSFHVTR